MTRRKVLIVCMLDSVHAARWLNQFTDQDIDFVIFPSKKFKKIHPKIRALISSGASASFSIAHPIKILSIIGYLDFAYFIQLPRLIGINLRARYLRKVMSQSKFNFVHALEIQGAGYLCDEAIAYKNFKFILTNWGSDIFYFQHQPEHLPRIKSALVKADLYSAECKRDYQLAIDLGFRGKQLPCIPNVGGLVHSEDLSIGIPTSERINIVVKTYGGTFGRGDLAIKAVSKVLIKNRELTAYFYSVTEDLVSQVEKLKIEFGNRVRFSTTKNPISHDKLSDIFAKSRIYIGCAVSDGVSISFLEALVKGAYPIQTNTSCAGEWVLKGVAASVIDLSSEQLDLALDYAVSNDGAMDLAGLGNLEVAREHLSSKKIRLIAQDFYR